MVADALSRRAMIDLRTMFSRLSLFDEGDGVLCFRFRVCVPNNSDLRQSILREAHSFSYVIHPGGNKMYRDLYELKLRLSTSCLQVCFNLLRFHCGNENE
ncbi:integrase [Gossypium australe]|uniref:Integrase n=1 Tax=Gossypium australe TaxID=47621 RepID=A0A5B6V0Y5_9ROSI|nr:integrase [Gossypium australe]